MLLPHPGPLLEGRLVARYDRFIAVVELGRRPVDAHCVNPGAMEGLVRPGVRAWLSRVPPESPRKLRYTLELIEADGRIVGANTNAPNRIAEALVRARLVPGLRRFRSLEREVRYGERSRIDLLLRGGPRDHYVEVKNCHLVYPDRRAYFPDSVSERATGHLAELVARVEAGDRASVLFVVQRDDARALRPSALHDPAFAAAAWDAARAGVRFRAIRIRPELAGYRYLGPLGVDVEPYDPATLAPHREALRPWSGWKRRGAGGPPAR